MSIEQAPSTVRRPKVVSTVLIIVAILLVSLLLPNSRSASAAQTITLAPVADTYVRTDKPSTSYGAGTKLFVDANPATHTYLRFDLTGVGNNQIDSATLRLRSTTTTSDGGMIAPVNDDVWQESALTWNTAPSAELVPIAPIGPVTTGPWVSVNVTGLVGADPIQSFQVTSTSSTAAVYISREGVASLRPQLVVVTSPPSDLTLPTVSITSPADGSAISGPVDVTVNASDNVAVASVDVSLDGVLIGNDVAPPFSFPFETRGVANVPHVLQASAVDRAGNVGTSSPVTVTVTNTPDGQPPSPPTSLVAIPTSSNQVDLTWAAASDNVGVDHYLVLRDGAQVASVAITAHSDRTLQPSTTYTYILVAVDAAGNESGLSEILQLRGGRNAQGSEALGATVVRGQHPRTPAVIATVCSKCADHLPSTVTTVHSSSSIRVWRPPG